MANKTKVICLEKKIYQAIVKQILKTKRDFPYKEQRYCALKLVYTMRFKHDVT